MKKNPAFRTLSAILFALFLFLQPASALRSHAEDEGYHIYINVTANVITVYFNASPVRAMITSTGDATPESGTYCIPEKFRWGWLKGNVYGQYCTRIVKGILFHSVPYTDYGNCGSLKHGQFDLLGTRASMGCMRLCVGDAKWIYENIPVGTPVTFYNDQDTPGALGLPYSAAIDRFGPSLAGWDPTDPAESNPWNHYLGAAFNAEEYLAANPDLADLAPWTSESLKLHWLTSGIAEGRRGSAAFDLESYKNAHPELQARFSNDNYAWVEYYNQSGKSMRKSAPAAGSAPLRRTVRVLHPVVPAPELYQACTGRRETLPAVK
ncbi:MAG: L,D-transpeptidase [Lachnospiraceae bacterium]|nr:L,D-transpeptidase [Lachnospiraceae bacterium]